MNFDTLLLNASLCFCDPDREEESVLNGAIGVKDGKITWIGKQSDLSETQKQSAAQVTDLNHAWVTPGLIDCHTHLVYAGDRSHEFTQRLNGVSYEQIIQQGGGIHYTVAATREASEHELFQLAQARLQHWLEQGVTTMEIKSGYGLDKETELKMLRVAAQLGSENPITIKKTYLGAHTLPKEYADKKSYLDFICQTMLPEIAHLQLADAVDVYCESIAFDLDETKKILSEAKALGFDIKCHAEQLTQTGSAELAAQLKALSADHLEYCSKDGIRAMAEHGTVAVLLPGAYYYLNESTKPPIQKLLDAKVPIALGSDCNPGSSPMHGLLLIMNMACTLWGMSPSSVLRAVTCHGAQALGLGSTHGRLSEGYTADLAVWDVSMYESLCCQLGSNPCLAVYKDGERVYG